MASLALVSAAALASVWTNGQTLRWVHVGLLAAGESLYLGNAVTGLAMKSPKRRAGQ